jgi:diacylglycerol kinase
MNKEIPNSTTTAPTAIASALELERLLEPEVLLVALVLTAVGALVVEVAGATGMPGDSGLVVGVGVTASAIDGTIRASTIDETIRAITNTAPSALAHRALRL